jgi:hypothetical protein
MRSSSRLQLLLASGPLHSQQDAGYEMLQHSMGKCKLAVSKQENSAALPGKGDCNVIEMLQGLQKLPLH